MAKIREEDSPVNFQPGVVLVSTRSFVQAKNLA
jgi:hypothetical protein